MSKCRIRCLLCREFFPSPIEFGSADLFYSSALVGNTVQCRHCGRLTDCNKNNMRFFGDGEGFVGKDTVGPPEDKKAADSDPES